MGEYCRYVAMFDKFFRSASMASTYKPMFVRALADVGGHDRDDLIGRRWIHLGGGRVRLDLDFVAVRLAKYYWDMDAAFEVRHTPERMADHKNPWHDIAIIKIVRKQQRRERKDLITKTINGMDDEILSSHQRMCEEIRSVLSQIKPPTLKDLASDGMAAFRAEVVDAMQEVLDHLRTDMPDLYAWNKDEHHIEFDEDLLDFMKDAAGTVKAASCHLLARKLEQINPSARLVSTMTNASDDIDATLEDMRRLSDKIRPDPMRAVINGERAPAEQAADLSVLIRQNSA